ncbi:hypothetical protein DFH06DRAFT_1334234 [Mycena polygramma]|nr:hypothetical protein DFH06DRAFT_1334234 [Mycena polygramma]
MLGRWFSLATALRGLVLCLAHVLLSHRVAWHACPALSFSSCYKRCTPSPHSHQILQNTIHGLSDWSIRRLTCAAHSVATPALHDAFIKVKRTSRSKAFTTPPHVQKAHQGGGYTLAESVAKQLKLEGRHEIFEQETMEELEDDDINARCMALESTGKLINMCVD